MAVVGAFVRFSRTAVVRRNELQFASKASHHRRAPSTWEGGRASAHSAGLPLDALSNCKPPLQEDRSHEAIQRTTKLCFEVHQPNLTAEAAGLRTARHHPIIPQTSERGREGGRLFFSKSEQMPTRALPARGLARGRRGRRTCSLLPPRRHKNHAALAGTHGAPSNTAKISLARGSSNCDRAKPCKASSAAEVNTLLRNKKGGLYRNENSFTLGALPLTTLVSADWGIQVQEALL